MNIKLISIVAALFSSTAIFTGCNLDDDSEEGISIKNVEHIIGEDFKEGIDKEKDITILDLDGDGKDEYIVKYRTNENEKPLGITILSKRNGKLKIRDTIKNVGEDFDEIKYIDINDDGRLEIIAGLKVGENISKGLNIYDYNNGKIIEIFEEYYSDYILRDINNDGKKEIIIIKENEKNKKSYAYLYRWKDDEFENTKKVEINSTLDTREEIIEKLLEK